MSYNFCKNMFLIASIPQEIFHCCRLNVTHHMFYVTVTLNILLYCNNEGYLTFIFIRVSVLCNQTSSKDVVGVHKSEVSVQRLIRHQSSNHDGLA